MKIFIFGTLLNQEVLDLVIGKKIVTLNKISNSSITDFKALFVENENYPMLIKSEKSKIMGKIISIKDPESIQRLCYYEGEENPLIEISKDRNLHAFVADSSLTPSQKKWCYEEWQNSKLLHEFIIRVRDYMAQYNRKEESKW